MSGKRFITLPAAGTQTTQDGIATTIFTATANGTVTDADGEKSLIGAGLGSLIYTPVAGQNLMILWDGFFSTNDPSAATFRLKKGSTVLASWTNRSLEDSSTNYALRNEWLLTFRTATACMVNPLLDIGSSAPFLSSLLPDAPNAVPVVVSAAAETIDFTAQWTAGSGTLTVTNVLLAIC